MNLLIMSSKMLAVTSFCFFHLFGLVYSSPTIAFEEKAFAFGIFTGCVGIFGLVGACLFCRRRKRKFERSSDNLLENDNNNVELSEEALENIENNNAHEVLQAVHSSLLTRENEVRSTSRECENSFSEEMVEIKQHDEDDPDCSLTSVSILIPSDEPYDAFGEVNFNSCHFDSNQMSPEKCSSDHTSISDVSCGGSSNNMNSVEEALRELDFAIEGFADAETPQLLEVVTGDLPLQDSLKLGECYESSKALVDDVLTEALQIVEGMREQENCFSEFMSDLCTASTPAVHNKHVARSDIANIPKCVFEDVDNKESSTEGSVTITPMNTPNEPSSQQNDKTWSMIVAMNLMKNQPADTNLQAFDKTFNKTFDQTYKVADGSDAEDEKADVDPVEERPEDATFDVAEDDHWASDRERNIEQLREMLGVSLMGMQSQRLDDFSNENQDNELNMAPEDLWEPAAKLSPPNIVDSSEIFLNYNKRCLSPIMEESEDENTKTFGVNAETRYIDSISTGYVETEAMAMGITKTLMASNDTLFNFDDTLCDEKCLSPSTPTVPEATFIAKPTDLNFASEKTFFVNDLLSPDMEADSTFTVEDKTYVTVRQILKNDEERISEISEPELVSSSMKDDDGTEHDDEITSIEEDLPDEDFHNTDTLEDGFEAMSNETVSNTAVFEKSTSFENLKIQPESEEPNLTVINMDEVDAWKEEENEVSSKEMVLSGEEDPWATMIVEDEGASIQAEATWIEKEPHENLEPLEGTFDVQPGEEVKEALQTSDSGDDEEEFIPSSWDSSMVPTRSALSKSPENSLEDNTKKRKNVAFKVQKYHSVYEYPKEVLPQVSVLENESFEDPFQYEIEEMSDDLVRGDIDGFMISSTARPFYSNKIRYGSWMEESTDFSWSQIQEELADTVQLAKARPLIFSDKPSQFDSGVGESVDSFYEKPEESLEPCLGELRYAKHFLKLPLEKIMVEAPTKADTAENPTILPEEQDEDKDKNISVTPGGSMDSLSTSTSSSNSHFVAKLDERKQDSGIATPGESTLMSGKAEKYIFSARLSDSTDDDSGIENLTRIANNY